LNWLQNGILIVVSFLLARIIIDADIHTHYLSKAFSNTGHTVSRLVTTVLVSSYVLSLFFPNTVVALSMIPLIRLIVDRIGDTVSRKRAATHLVLALIYGANIGGMGSMVGSPQNILFLGFLEIAKVPGREHITYLVWLLIGVPATLVMIAAARLILKIGEKTVQVDFRLEPPEIDEGERKRILSFFAANLAVVIALSALQLIVRPGAETPAPVWIDVLFCAYLVWFLVNVLFVPRRGRGGSLWLKNVVFFLFYLFAFPLIWISETLGEAGRRFGWDIHTGGERINRLLLRLLDSLWLSLFGETRGDLRKPNTHARVSVNRFLYDLPYLGLLFMGAVIALIYIVLSLGNNPDTPALDGYVVSFFGDIAFGVAPSLSTPILFMGVTVLVAIFLTELINNTTVMLVMFPVVLEMSHQTAINPVFFLLGITIAVSSAFMSPLATSVNAVSFAGVPGVSLRKMILLGFILNILAALWITLLGTGIQILV
jgi:sodium-dependent dicarboxylate transporter 2/3/5